MVSPTYWHPSRPWRPCPVHWYTAHAKVHTCRYRKGHVHEHECACGSRRNVAGSDAPTMPTTRACLDVSEASEQDDG